MKLERRTSPEVRTIRSGGGRSRVECGHRRGVRPAESHAAGTPVAPGKAFKRRGKRVCGEIRPEGVDEQQFGIGRLPEHEIGKTNLARGADNQVRRRQVAGVQKGVDVRRLDLVGVYPARPGGGGDRAGRPHRSEEHTSELQSLMRISYAVFCLKKQTST